MNSFGNFSRRRGVWAPSRLQVWKETIQAGDVVVAPAEGVYGYCCDPFNERAVHKIFSLKQRASSKGLIVLCSTIFDVRRVADISGPLQRDILKAMNEHWPGAVTLILPAKESAPDYLTGGNGTVAVRIPSAEYMHEYLAKWRGPLVSTSLNISGQTPARTASAIPYGPVALKYPETLPGTSSRIYNVITGTWER
ncbi:MAG: L-threonylcarbamoyladenylate synthase [bacterium]